VKTILLPILLLLASGVCLRGVDESIAVQRLKDMISMIPPVEGVVVETIGTTNDFVTFGNQTPGTWFFIQNKPNSETDQLMAAGQSYLMTWAYSGNMVQALPRAETLALQTVPGGEGRLAPETFAEHCLMLLSYRTRFGLHVAETNLHWNDLSFEAFTQNPSFPDGSKISGKIEVSNGIPVRIRATLTTPSRVSTRITELSRHDTNGFPRVWNLSIDGKPAVRSIHFRELTFAPRYFVDGDGYTPSLLGESGRQFAIYYSNRTQHVMDPRGGMREITSLSPLTDSASGPWFIGIGVIGVAATIAIFVTRKTRQSSK